MLYAVKADILEQLPESDLIGLTDDPGTGEVDDSVVDRAIADAAALIESYIHGRYPAPLDPVPPVIRRIAVDLAIYDLFSRRSMDCPEIRKDRHKAAMSLLDRLADGRVTLGVETPAPASSSHTAEMTGSDSVFSGGNRGF